MRRRQSPTRSTSLFRLLRENKVTAPPIAIATAYINPAVSRCSLTSWRLAPRVRLLLGAEPEEESVRAITSGRRRTRTHVETLRSLNHQAWLQAERDTMGFARVP